MVGVRGFEPPTPASRTQCSTRLSHTPTFFSTRAKGRRCAEEGAYSHGFRTSQAGNSRLLKKSLIYENSSVFRCCIPESLGVSHRSSQQRTAGALVLLGNGVMVTQRFLVPSFKVRVLVPQPPPRKGLRRFASPAGSDFRLDSETSGLLPARNLPHTVRFPT